MNPDVTTNENNTQPTRRRRRMGPLSCGAVLVLLLVIVRLFWGWDAERRWQNAVATLHSGGECLFDDDPARGPLPEARNAATYYYRASQALDPRFTLDADGDFEAPSAPQSRALPRFTRTFTTNAEALQAFHDARAINDVDWGRKRTLFPTDAIQAKRLLGVVSESIRFCLLSGDHARAVELTRDLLHFTRLYVRGGGSPQIISAHVTERRIIGYVATTLIIAGAGNASGSNVTTRQAVAPASDAQVRALISDLMDPRRNEMLGEALAGESAGLFAMGGDLVQQRRGMPLAPAWELRFLKTAKPLISAVAAARSRDFQMATSLLPARPAKPDPDDLILDHMNLARGSWELASILLKGDYELRGLRIGVAVVLASKLYLADHGHAPDSIEQLVPDYLSGLPIDPLRSGDVNFDLTLAQTRVADQ